MKLTLNYRKVWSDDKISVVFNCYERALANFAIVESEVETVADEKLVKSSLTITDKQDLSGIGASFLRFIQYSHAAYFELSKLDVTLSKDNYTFYMDLRTELIKQLALARYDSDNLTSTAAITQSLGSEELTDHFILIAEIICRIIAVALDEQSILKRKKIAAHEDDKVVAVLKCFLTFLTTKVDVLEKLFSKSGIPSTLVRYIKKHLIDEGSSDINLFIYNVQATNSPKKYFSQISESLKITQISMRGYLLGFFDLIVSELNLQVGKIIQNSNILKEENILTYYTPVIATLLAKAQSTTSLMNISEEVIDQHNAGVFDGQYRIIITMLTLESQKIKKQSVRTKTQGYISRLRELLSLDEQVHILQLVVGKFIAITEFGNLIPIYLGDIRPDILATAIKKFAIVCKVQTDECGEILDEAKPLWSLGIAALPIFQWSTLGNITTNIYNLNSAERLKALSAQYRQLMTDLSPIEGQLLQHRLIEREQHIAILPPPPELQQRAWTEYPILSLPPADNSGRSQTWNPASSTPRASQQRQLPSLNPLILTSPMPSRRLSTSSDQKTGEFPAQTLQRSSSRLAPSSALFTPAQTATEPNPTHTAEIQLLEPHQQHHTPTPSPVDSSIDTNQRPDREKPFCCTII